MQGQRSIWIQFAIWAVLLTLLCLFFSKRVANTRRAEHQQFTPVTLPWFGQEELGQQEFQMELQGAPQSLQIRADDSVELIEIDGQTNFVGKAKAGLHCDYTAFPLPRDLSPGKHQLRVTMRNLQGEAWFDIKEAHGFTWLKAMVLLMWGFGAFAFAARCGYRPWVGWPLLIAGLLVIQYLDVTTPWVRQHDVEGHREYVDYVSNTCRLPPVQQGWETWQPPLYYYVAAGWRWLFSNFSYDDPFRPVQFLSAVLYVATIVLSLPTFQRLKLNALEATVGLSTLALIPGHLFFAARINNDVLLPLLSGGLLFVLTEFIRADPESIRGWLWWMAALLPAMLATKGSSLAIAGGTLAVVFAAECRRSGWHPAFKRAYLTGLPAGLWLLFWWWRTALQTGDPLYVNAALPDNLRIFVPAWRRLLSFDFTAFLGGQYYYDEPMRQSYPTALITSLLYGEYGMSNYGFHGQFLLRWGTLGMLLILAAGILVRPRPDLRPVWIVSLCLVACHIAITIAYAVKFPFACNQNMRFFAQAFVPAACLWSLGISHFWIQSKWFGRGIVIGIAVTLLLGLGDFYARVLF